MISITLTFNSIEAARQALLDIPASALVGGPAPEKPQDAPAKPAKPPKAEPVAQTPAAKVEAPAPVPQKAEPETKVDAPAAIEYPVLQKAVFALAGKSRDAASAVVSTFGVKTFRDLPADQWAAALEAVQAKLAELEAA